MKKWVVGMAVLVLFLLPFSVFAADTVYEQVYGQPEMDGTVYEEEAQNNNEEVQSSGDVFHSGSPTNSNTFTISARNVPADTVKVMLKVWTTKGGQDDVKWYEMENSDGIYSYTVNSSSHKLESGEYNAEVYLQDTTGAQILFGTTQVYINKIYASNFIVPQTFATESFTARVEGVAHEGGDDQIKRVLFATWTDEGGQDDIKWYWGVKVDEGVWEYTVQVSPNHHDRYGNYNVHMYGEDKSGNRTFLKSFVVTRVNSTYVTTVQENNINLDLEIDLNIDSTTLGIIESASVILRSKEENPEEKIYSGVKTEYGFHFTGTLDDFVTLPERYDLEVYCVLAGGEERLVDTLEGLDFSDKVENFRFQCSRVSVNTATGHSYFDFSIVGLTRNNGEAIEDVYVKYRKEGHANSGYTISTENKSEEGAWKARGEVHNYGFERGNYEYIVYAKAENGQFHEVCRGTDVVSGFYANIFTATALDSKSTEVRFRIGDIKHVNDWSAQPNEAEVTNVVVYDSQRRRYEAVNIDGVWQIDCPRIDSDAQNGKYIFHVYGNNTYEEFFLGQLSVQSYGHQNWNIYSSEITDSSFDVFMYPPYGSDELDGNIIFKVVKDGTVLRTLNGIKIESDYYSRSKYTAAVNLAELGNPKGKLYLYAYLKNGNEEEFLNSHMKTVNWMNASSVTSDKTFIKECKFDIHVNQLTDTISSVNTIYAVVPLENGLSKNTVVLGNVSNGKISVDIPVTWGNRGKTGVMDIEVFGKDSYGTNLLGSVQVDLCSVIYSSVEVYANQYNPDKKEVIVNGVRYADGSQVNRVMAHIYNTDGSIEYLLQTIDAGSTFIFRADPSFVLYQPGTYYMKLDVISDSGFETKVTQQYAFEIPPVVHKDCTLAVKEIGTNSYTVTVSNISLVNPEDEIAAIYIEPVIREGFNTFHYDLYHNAKETADGSWQRNCSISDTDSFMIFCKSTSGNVGYVGSFVMQETSFSDVAIDFADEDGFQVKVDTNNSWNRLEDLTIWVGKTSETLSKYTPKKDFNSYYIYVNSSELLTGCYIGYSFYNNGIFYDVPAKFFRPQNYNQISSFSARFSDGQGDQIGIKLTGPENKGYYFQISNINGGGRYDLSYNTKNITPKEFGFNAGDYEIRVLKRNYYGQEKIIGTISVKVPGLTIEGNGISNLTPGEQPSANFDMFVQSVRGNSYNGYHEKKIEFEVWSDFQGDGDKYTYVGQYDPSSGRYLASGNIVNHNQDRGIYQIDIYGYYGPEGNQIKTYLGRMTYDAGLDITADFSFIQPLNDVLSFDIVTSITEKQPITGGYTVKYYAYLEKDGKPTAQEFTKGSGNVNVSLNGYQFKTQGISVEGYLFDSLGRKYFMGKKEYAANGGRYFYDDRNRLIRIEAKDGIITEFVYDENGNMTVVTSLQMEGV